MPLSDYFGLDAITKYTKNKINVESISRDKVRTSFNSPKGYVDIPIGVTGSHFLDALQNILKKNTLKFFLGGQYNNFNVFINYLDSPRNRLKISTSLNELAKQDHESRLFSVSKDSKAVSLELLARLIIDRSKTPQKIISIYIHESIDQPWLGSGQNHNIDHVSCIIFKPWIPYTLYEGKEGYEPLSKHSADSIVRRLTKNTFDYLCQNPSNEKLFTPYSNKINFPIDAVFTWVDSKDDQWLEKKNKFSNSLWNWTTRSTITERYDSNNELLYSLRSLELYAPWINHIYIVTDNQCPNWLDLEKARDRITIIDHKEIFNTNELPCFNSSALETRLHKIPNLSEHFLYLNDDFFFGQPVLPEDFFLSNGIIRCFPSRQRVLPFDITSESEEYIQADKNAIDLIIRTFGNCRNEFMRHIAYPSSKDLLFEIEDQFRDGFNICASNKFRSTTDLRPIAFFQYHYGWHRGKVQFSDISHRYISLSMDDLDQKLSETLLKRSRKTICLNDSGTSGKDRTKLFKSVNTFLESYFPYKLKYESNEFLVS